MPLRDHFRPPVWSQASWEGFHGGWAMMMVLNVAPKLPKGFAAEPRVHLGIFFEIDICAFFCTYSGLRSSSRRVCY